MKTVFIGVLAAAMMALLISCGGGDETTSGGGDEATTTAATKAQFIKRADVICRQIDTAQTALLAEYKKNPEGTTGRARRKELVTVVGLPPVENAVEEIKALGVPEEDGEEMQKLIKAWEDGIIETKVDPLHALTSPTTPFSKADHMALALGFEYCSEML